MQQQCNQMCIKEFNLNSKIKQEEYAISFFSAGHHI